MRESGNVRCDKNYSLCKVLLWNGFSAYNLSKFNQIGYDISFPQLKIAVSLKGGWMKKCSTCARALIYWHLRCRVCKSYNYRLPHIISSAIVVLILFVGCLFILNNFALERTPLSQPALSQKSDLSAQPASSQKSDSSHENLQLEQIRNERIAAGKWRGTP